MKDNGSRDTGYLLGLDTAEKAIQNQIKNIRDLLPHSGEIGSEVERVFHEALADALPERVGVCSGFVQDSKGAISKQLDIILFDKFATLPIFSKGISILPSECVYAAGEIKTKLNKTEIFDAFVKCASFKNLDRSAQLRPAYFAQPVKFEGVDISALWHPFFFVLAAETGTTENFRNTTRDALDAQQAAGALIDAIFSLDGNTRIAAKTADHPDKLVEDKLPEKVGLILRSGYSWCSYFSQRPWAMFVAMINAHLASSPSTRVNMTEYLGNARF
ncbi:DUF6602 domain-containing protein [Ruegeria sp. 6PALISEP08]|uniref:DUF6602 domain-containing protein n=1 Tax=Ruegeria sp. 6PALISEP08 TaxID=1225660 RepID=UPI00067ECBD2|nr:DUF6602 domain-containing protein [Ruegeria sp. 6PALISEP08]